MKELLSLRYYRFLKAIKIEDFLDELNAYLKTVDSNKTTDIKKASIQKYESNLPLQNVNLVQFFSDYYGITPNFFFNNPEFKYSFRILNAEVRKGELITSLSDDIFTSDHGIISNLVKVKVAGKWKYVLLDKNMVPSFASKGRNKKLMSDLGEFPGAKLSTKQKNLVYVDNDRLNLEKKGKIFGLEVNLDNLEANFEPYLTYIGKKKWSKKENELFKAAINESIKAVLSPENIVIYENIRTQKKIDVSFAVGGTLFKTAFKPIDDPSYKLAYKQLSDDINFSYFLSEVIEEAETKVSKANKTELIQAALFYLEEYFVSKILPEVFERAKS